MKYGLATILALVVLFASACSKPVEPWYVDVYIERITFLTAYAEAPADAKSNPFIVRIINVNGEKVEFGIPALKPKDDPRLELGGMFEGGVKNPGRLTEGFTLEIVPPTGENHKVVFHNQTPRTSPCVYYGYSRDIVSGKDKLFKQPEFEFGEAIGCPMSMRVPPIKRKS